MFGSAKPANPFGPAGTTFGVAAAPTPGFTFGAPATNTQQPAAGTSGATSSNPFGASTGGFGTSSTGTSTFGGFGQNAQKPATGGLFSTPQSGSNAFGATQPAGQTGGLFGSTSTQPQLQPQQPAQGTSTGFGFGSTSTFGTGFSAQPNQNQTGSSLFGGGTGGYGTQQNASGLFGSTSFTQPLQQQDPNPIVYENGVPGRYGLNSIWVPEGPLTKRGISKDEMFKFTSENDRDLANLLREVEAELNSQKKAFDDIKSGTLAADILSTQRMTRGLHSGYQTYLNAFKDLERRTASLQSEIDVIQKDFDGAVSVLQWQMNHQEDMKDFERVRNAPAEFYFKVAKDCAAQAESYCKTLGHIESQIMSLTNQSNVPTARAISESMSNNQDLIMSLAAQVADLDERVKRLVDIFRERYREKYNTIMDPVNERRRIDGIPARGYSGDRDDGVLGSMAGMGFRS